MCERVVSSFFGEVDTSKINSLKSKFGLKLKKKPKQNMLKCDESQIQKNTKKKDF